MLLSFNMATFGGFWSYAHDDDDADFGRITDLARDLVANYKMLTGDPIELFLDRDSIAWGQAWKQRVDSSLSSVAFFVPVLTPTFFKRPECRRELRFFADKAKSLGLSELIMPVLWVDFDALHEEKPSDDLIALVRTFQWVDWTERKFSERASGEYRRAVSEMAQRLVDANAAAAINPPGPGAQEQDATTEGEILESEDLGIADRIAIAEEAITPWLTSLESIGALVVELGDAMRNGVEGIEESDKEGKGFVGRVNVYRNTASNLARPADEAIKLGNDFAARLNEVDNGFRAIVENVAEGVAVDDEADVRDFYDSIRDLAQTTDDSMDTLQDLLSKFGNIERMSRDLRAPLKKFRTGLTSLLEGRAIIDDWVVLLNENPILIVDDRDDETGGSDDEVPGPYES